MFRERFNTGNMHMKVQIELLRSVDTATLAVLQYGGHQRDRMRLQMRANTKKFIVVIIFIV